MTEEKPVAKKKPGRPRKIENLNIQPEQDAKEIVDIAPEATDDPLAKINMENVVVYMKNGFSYSGPGIHFDREAPFQIMEPIEAERLIKSMPYRFEYADKEKVKEFYNIGS